MVCGGLALPIICWALSTIRLIFTVTMAVVVVIDPSLIVLESKWKWICGLILALGTVIDSLLAILLITYLKLAQRTTENKR